jgi:FKBP-type peptidyl-prolyl cis-trans isomerase
MAVCLVFAAAWVVAQEALPAADPLAAAPPTDARHYSYAIGQQIGKSFREDGMEFDPESLLEGLKAGLAGAESKYSQELLDVAIQRMLQLQQRKLMERGELARREGEAYLAANAKKEGVVTLPSGLQYKVLAAGTGASPKATDIVDVKYRGTFIDGKMFDESGDDPVTFPVNRVIDGWTEALQKMKVGDKWLLVVPSDLAYGPEGRDGIPPFSTLVFEVELLGIQGQ